MRKLSIFTAIAALVAPLALHAAEPAKTEAPARTDAQKKADMQRGAKILSLFSGALQNKDIPEDQKNYIYACLYQNKLENISVATGNVLAANPKLDGNDPKVLYKVSATICGVNKAPSVANAAKPAPDNKPKTSSR
ncbi:MAG: hypothetical protein R3E21_07735 [Caenibius sp.]